MTNDIKAELQKRLETSFLHLVTKIHSDPELRTLSNEIKSGKIPVVVMRELFILGGFSGLEAASDICNERTREEKK